MVYLQVNHDELEQLSIYLKYFHDVIEKLSGDHPPTIRLVTSNKQLLFHQSNSNDDDCQDLTHSKRHKSKHLKDDWIIYDTHFIAMLWHLETNIQQKLY